MVPPCACLTRSKRPGLPFQLPKLAYGLMPDLRDVAELMRAMTEESATRLRDAALAFQVRGWLPPLDTRPDLAGLSYSSLLGSLNSTSSCVPLPQHEKSPHARRFRKVHLTARAGQRTRVSSRAPRRAPQLCWTLGVCR